MSNDGTGPYGPPPNQPPAGPGYQAGPEAVPQPKRKGNKKWWIALAVTALVFGSCGAAIGGGGETASTVAGEPGPTVTVTTTAAAEEGAPAPAVTETVEVPGPTVTETAEAAAPAAPAAPASAFSDGQFIVGSEIAPGRYRTVLPAEQVGGLCYVDIKNGDDYLAQELTDAGQTILDVPDFSGAILDSNDCGEWAPVP